MRDNYICQYCNKKNSQLTIDHVIPRDRGGKTSWENIVTSCLYCNTRKGNRFPHEAGLRLKNKPVRPKWRPFISFFLGSEYNESWRHFLKATWSWIRWWFWGHYCWGAFKERGNWWFYFNWKRCWFWWNLVLESIPRSSMRCWIVHLFTSAGRSRQNT